MRRADPPPLDKLLVNTAFVRGVARAVLGPDDRVEDVVQDTWVVALGQGPAQPASLRAWLGRVARNLALHVRRQDVARRRREARAARPESPAPIDALLEQERMRKRLVAAVLSLEEPYRTTLLLCYHQGLAPRQVAAMLGLPLETVRTHLKRGAARIRRALQEGSGASGARERSALLVLALPEGLALQGVAAGAAAIGWGALVMKKITLGVAAVALLAFGGVLARDCLRADRQSTAPSAARAGDAPTPAPSLDTRGEPPAESRPPEPVAGEPERGMRLVVQVRDDITGEAVEDALVTLCHMYARRDEEPQGRTDAQGRVELLIARRQDVADCIVQHAAYAPLVAPLYETLKDRVEGERIEMTPLRLLRGSSIRGVVLDAERRTQVPGAELFLAAHQTPGAFGFAHPEMQVASDERGAFTLERVRPSPLGTWFLYAVSETSIGWTELPGSVGRNDVEGVEVRLQPAAQVVVRVVDEDARPVLGALAQVQPHFEPMRTADWGDKPDAFMWFRVSDRVRGRFERMTDADGGAAFAGLPVPRTGPGRYRASARAQDRQPALSEAFELAAGGRHEVTLVLRRATTLTLAGQILAREGGPIEGAIVKLNTHERARTDAEGRFTIRDVDRRNGWAQLRVEAEGFATVVRRQDFPPTGDAPPITATLWPALPIAGRVADQDGAPVAGAYVDLLRGGLDGPAVPSAQTDAEGKFRFEGATAQAFTLRVFPPQPYWRWKQQAGGFPSVHGGQTDVRVVIERVEPGRARIAARVQDATSGTRLDVSEAMLIREPDGSGVQTPPARVEAPGVVVDEVPPGVYMLWVRVGGRPAASVRVVVDEADRELSVAVAVPVEGDARRLRGRVVLAGGAVPEHALVTADPADAWSRPGWAVQGQAGSLLGGVANVSADGAFEFPGLLPGRYRVRMIATGWLGVAEVQIDHQAPADLVLEGRRGAVLELVSAGPVPKGTAAVAFRTSRDGKDWKWQMNLGGIAGKTARHAVTLEPGDWHWKVSFDADNIAGAERPAAETQQGRVELVAGETRRVEVPVVPVSE